MRKFTKLFLFLFVSVALSSCLKDDLEDLQKQVDDLNQKVDDLEQSQQAALLAAIQSMESSISNLETTNSQQYADLLANLESIAADVESNSNKVFYGNVLTQADYDALTLQGATIITGKVAVYAAEHLTALQNVVMIGGELSINVPDAITLDNLTGVGADLIIQGVTGADANVSMALLSSVGGSLHIIDNSGIVQANFAELVFINDQLWVENNSELTTLSLAKLDQVNELYVSAYFENDPNYIGIGKLANVDLSGTNVTTDVDIMYLSTGGDIVIGNVGGNFNLYYTGVNTLTINSSTIGGDLNIQYNNSLTDIITPNLTRVEGGLDISSNHNGYYWDATETTGIVTMPSFATLVYIGGNVRISDNQALISMESFNNVTEVAGSSIDITSNNSLMEIISVFSSLTTAGPSQYTGVNINVFQNTNWFDGFHSLTKANEVYVTVQKPVDNSGGGIGWGTNEVTTQANFDVAKLSGFNALTSVKLLSLNVSEVTDFSGFESITEFKVYQTFLTVYMPTDSSVGMCSMEPVFTKLLNGDFDVPNSPNRKAYFSYNWNEMDRDSAVAQLLAPCGV